MPEHVNKKRRGQRRPILAIMNGTDLRQWTYEKGQMHIKSYKDVYNWPARDLNKCSKEVALVDIALAQIGSVLDVAVVTHEAHHAGIGISFSNCLLYHVLWWWCLYLHHEISTKVHKSEDVDIENENKIKACIKLTMCLGEVGGGKRFGNNSALSLLINI